MLTYQVHTHTSPGTRDPRKTVIVMMMMLVMVVIRMLTTLTILMTLVMLEMLVMLVMCNMGTHHDTIILSRTSYPQIRVEVYQVTNVPSYHRDILIVRN